MHINLLEVLPGELARIVQKYICCRHCVTEAKEGYHICMRCMDFDMCLLEFTLYVPRERLLLPSQGTQILRPLRYRLEKPERAFVRFQCAWYEALFYRRRCPMSFCSRRFPIVQTRCHTEKYVFDHTKYVKNAAFVYLCVAPFIIASILLFPQHEKGVRRVSRIFSLAYVATSWYSFVKI